MIPHTPSQIHLLCTDEEHSQAFKEAKTAHRLPASVPIQIHNCPLSELPLSVQFDVVVSATDEDGITDGMPNALVTPKNCYY
ncbi:hypothetical protein AK830_g2793 [Neonectria ditissima]|uniref:Uncharacterized protein n=1 Tax=Neonectria ditissima TaxID=78410 RepID=A0A0P7BJ99_9HYPO|nr:hypothetical protein AK830_g2793 [Neonectria ditissima]